MELLIGTRSRPSRRVQASALYGNQAASLSWSYCRIINRKPRQTRVLTTKAVDLLPPLSLSFKSAPKIV